MLWRMWRRTAGAAVAVVALVGAGTPAGAQQARTATVRAVVDGDTVRVALAGRTGTIDLVGVRAPVGRACFAAQSRAALRRLLPAGTRVRVVDEPALRGRGRYVLKGGRLVNAAVLRAGGARLGALAGVRRRGALRDAEAAARRARRGLFGRCAGSAPPADATVPTGDGPRGPLAQRTAIRQALEGRVLSDVRTDSQSSTRNDTTFCADGRAERREELIPRDAPDPVRAAFAGSWAILDTAANPDGSTSAEVVVRADDPSFDTRTLRLVLGTDGQVRNVDFAATQVGAAPGPCAAAPPGAPNQNDTPQARDGLVAALQGARLEAAGRQTDVCPGPRLVRREAGDVAADGALVVEWALSDGATRAGVLQVADAARGTSRRLLVAIDAQGAVSVREFGRGEGQTVNAVRGAAAC
jgi:micrococcal nuclease